MALFPTLILLLTWLQPSEMRRYELRGRAQGTTWSVIYYAADSLVTRGACDSVLASLDSSLSIYKPYSRINALNAAARSYRLDHHLEVVLTRGQQMARKTGGAFDMVILPLVDAWGFGASRHQQPPDSGQVAHLRGCTGYRQVKVRRHHVRKQKPCNQLDVNGIAQGYSVDVLAAFLERHGIADFLVEIGGELRVKGQKQPSGTPFSVGIESPEAENAFGAPLQQQLQLKTGALTTSGNYRRYYLSGNKAISHLLDPRTGFPVHNELISVTVWAPDALTADAVDNALMVMGLEQSLRFLEQQKELEAYFIYKKPDGTVADTATEGFLRMLPPSL